MDKKTIKIMLNRLDEHYGTKLHCYLEYETAWQLLIATILSAQCTDKRVNMLTKELFKKYDSVEAFANADISILEQDIKPAGFQHSKAKNIIECMKSIRDNYDGVVPSDIDKLTELAGVGRKTANVIRGNIYDIPSVVVDTHVKRISGRLDLTDNTDPVKIEKDLMKVIPEDHWILINIQFIALGRTICKAVKPSCSECFLSDICKSCSK